MLIIPTHRYVFILFGINGFWVCSMEEVLFRLLFLVIYAIFFGVRIRYRIESARKEPEQRKKLSEAGKLLAIAILCSFASIIIYLLDVQLVSWSKLGLPFWIRWFGVFGATVSIILVAWTHLALGRQYSAELAIQKNHVPAIQQDGDFLPNLALSVK